MARSQSRRVLNSRENAAAYVARSVESHWTKRKLVSGIYDAEAVRVLREAYGLTVTNELKLLIDYMVENDARYPTLAQFLRLVPATGTFYITTRDHALAVRNGEIIEDNEVRQMRARVVSVYRIEEGP